MSSSLIEQPVGGGVHLVEVAADRQIQLRGRRAAQFIGDCVEGSAHARMRARVRRGPPKSPQPTIA